MKEYNKEELSQLLTNLSDEEKVIKLQEYLVYLNQNKKTGTYKAAIVAIKFLRDCNNQSATHVLLTIATSSYNDLNYRKEKKVYWLNFGFTARKAAIKALSKTTNKSLVIDILIKELYEFGHYSSKEILQTLSKICTKKDIGSLLELCSWLFALPPEYKAHQMIPEITDLIQLLWKKG